MTSCDKTPDEQTACAEAGRSVHRYKWSFLGKKALKELSDSYRKLLDEFQQTFAPEKLCVCTLPLTESPVEHFISMITDFNVELRRLVNNTPSDERPEVIEQYGSMTGQQCIAKDDIHPNKKRMEAITELHQNFSDEQSARVGNKNIEDSHSKKEEEQHFWIPRKAKRTPPAVAKTSNETTPIQRDQTTIMEPLFGTDEKDKSELETFQFDECSTKQGQHMEWGHPPTCNQDNHANLVEALWEHPEIP